MRWFHLTEMVPSHHKPPNPNRVTCDEGGIQRRLVRNPSHIENHSKYITLLTLAGTHSFTPCWEFTITPIHYNIYTLPTLSFLLLCLMTSGSGLFAWISRTTLSWSYVSIRPVIFLKLITSMWNLVVIHIMRLGMPLK